MKRLFILLLGTVLLQSINAETPEYKSGITAELDFGIGKNHEAKFFTILHPRVSYRFTPRWEAGLMTKFNINGRYSDPFIELGAYGEFSYLLVNQFRWFVDAQVVWAGGYERDFIVGGKPVEKDPRDFRHSFTEFGIVPGVAYRIPGSMVDIKLRYLFIGFNNGDEKYKSVSGCSSGRDFIIDAGLRRLEIGVSYTF